jgi:hypothetical protein
MRRRILDLDQLIIDRPTRGKLLDTHAVHLIHSPSSWFRLGRAGGIATRGDPGPAAVRAITSPGWAVGDNLGRVPGAPCAIEREQNHIDPLKYVGRVGLHLGQFLADVRDDALRTSARAECPGREFPLAADVGYEIHVRHAGFL